MEKEKIKQALIDGWLQGMMVIVLGGAIMTYLFLKDGVKPVASPHVSSPQPATTMPSATSVDYELGVTEVSVTTTNSYEEVHHDNKGRPCTKAIINTLGQKNAQEECYPKCNFNSDCATVCQAPASIGMCLRGIKDPIKEKKGEKKGICICSKERKK